MHPGGEEVIEKFKDLEVDKILFNPNYHKHNNHVISVMELYKYGYIQPNRTKDPFKADGESPLSIPKTS